MGIRDWGAEMVTRAKTSNQLSILVNFFWYLPIYLYKYTYILDCVGSFGLVIRGGVVESVMAVICFAADRGERRELLRRVSLGCIEGNRWSYYRGLRKIVCVCPVVWVVCITALYRCTSLCV